MHARRFEFPGVSPAKLRALAPGPPNIREAVAEIVEDVRSRGDEALREWTERLDRMEPRRASEAELSEALESLDQEVRASLKLAAENVRRVAEAELRDAIRVELPAGTGRGAS